MDYAYCVIILILNFYCKIANFLVNIQSATNNTVFPSIFDFLILWITVLGIWISPKSQ